MASAFACDLCSKLEAGTPAQRVAVTPEKSPTVAFDLCTECLVSFNEWRVSRAPEQDRPA